MDIINPATGAIISTIKSDTQRTLNSKLESLQKGQKSWIKTSIEHRLNCIKKFGELIQENKFDLAQILTSETGKPLQQSLNEIQGAQNRVDHLSQHAEQWLAPEVLVDEGSTLEHIKYEPLGVIANISAWNFPYNVGYNVFYML